MNTKHYVVPRIVKETGEAVLIRKSVTPKTETNFGGHLIFCFSAKQGECLVDYEYYVKETKKAKIAGKNLITQEAMNLVMHYQSLHPDLDVHTVHQLV